MSIPTLGFSRWWGYIAAGVAALAVIWWWPRVEPGTRTASYSFRLVRDGGGWTVHVPDPGASEAADDAILGRVDLIITVEKQRRGPPNWRTIVASVVLVSSPETMEILDAGRVIDSVREALAGRIAQAGADEAFGRAVAREGENVRRFLWKNLWQYLTAVAAIATVYTLVSGQPLSGRER